MDCPWCGNAIVSVTIASDVTTVECVRCHSRIVGTDAISQWDKLLRAASKKQNETEVKATGKKELFSVGQPVLVRDRDAEEWRYIWVFCIPYEGNEHLLGTIDSPVTHTADAEPEVPLMRPDYVEQHKQLVDAVIRKPVAPKPVCGCSAKVHGLKPCPWCGETADLHVIYKGTAPSKVQCQRCWRTVEAVVNGIEAWNDLPRMGDTNA